MPRQRRRLTARTIGLFVALGAAVMLIAAQCGGTPEQPATTAVPAAPAPSAPPTAVPAASPAATPVRPTPTTTATAPVTPAATPTSSPTRAATAPPAATSDFGDAPDGGATGYPTQFGQVAGFPTLLASNGARTLDLSRATLGAGASAEADANDPNDADGIPNLDPENTDSDDGIAGMGIVLSSIPAPATLTVNVTGGSGGDFFLNVLIDLNMDGQWGGEPDGAQTEWVVRNQAVSIGAGESREVVSDPFAYANGNRLPDGVWMRMALTDTAVPSGWTGTGEFAAGEIEDHLVWLPDLDGKDDVDGPVPAINCDNGGHYTFPRGVGLLRFVCQIVNNGGAGTVQWSLTGPHTGSVAVAQVAGPGPGAPIGVDAAFDPAGGDIIDLTFTARRGQTPSTWWLNVKVNDPEHREVDEGVVMGAPEPQTLWVFTGESGPAVGVNCQTGEPLAEGLPPILGFGDVYAVMSDDGSTLHVVAPYPAGVNPGQELADGAVAFLGLGLNPKGETGGLSDPGWFFNQSSQASLNMSLIPFFESEPGRYEGQGAVSPGGQPWTGLDGVAPVATVTDDAVQIDVDWPGFVGAFAQARGASPDAYADPAAWLYYLSGTTGNFDTCAQAGLDPDGLAGLPISPPGGMDFESAFPYLAVPTGADTIVERTQPIEPAGGGTIDIELVSMSLRGPSPLALPVVGDFDGDGRADLGILDQGMFVVLDVQQSSTSIDITPAQVFELPGIGPDDRAAAGDLNGDGRDELIVQSAQTGAGRVLDLQPDGLELFPELQLTLGDDVAPFALDVDGDGVDEPGFFAPGLGQIVLGDESQGFSGSVTRVSVSDAPPISALSAVQLNGKDVLVGLDERGTWQSFTLGVDEIFVPLVDDSLSRVGALGVAGDFDGDDAPTRFEIIFEDGFESGDTSAWSSTVP